MEAVADGLRIARLVMRRSVSGAMRSAGLTLRACLPRLPRGRPEAVNVAPQDLRTADPTVASEIYAGYFSLAGKVVAASGRSPFEIEPPSPAWRDELHGFSWLRHLGAADSALARANARALIEDWIRINGRGEGWTCDLVARRLIAWLSQSPMILTGADRDFYHRFMRALARQAAWLEKAIIRSGPCTSQLRGAIALAYVGLCTTGSPSLIRRASSLLASTLDKQILPDGGHISRNPGLLIEFLADLLPLRQIYAAQGIEAPQPLLNAVDRMMPMLRLFRHGDGHLALFNGMGATPPDLLATLLSYSDARAQPIENAVHSGYQRLQAHNAVLVMDAGPPPPETFSGEAHAGCLAFEFSDGPYRLIVNCGSPPPNQEARRQLARQTAAHSTISIGGQSSCRFLEGSMAARLGFPIIAGPKQVPVARAANSAGLSMRASHDGWRAAFGVDHERRLALAHDGTRLEGEDVFVNVQQGRVGPDGAPFALRFHLHPSVQAGPAGDGNSIALTLPSGEIWRFSCEGIAPQIDDSIFFAAPDGARPTRAIVVEGRVAETNAIRWSLVRQRA
jgi:uncharacterized heparinase superfamily protein